MGLTYTDDLKTRYNLHTIGLKVARLNKIYKNRYGKSYEKLIGVKHLYVTIDGKIYNSITCREVRTKETQDGYLTVSIAGSTFLVHRLVALAFCENILKTDKIVCHKNKNRKDNRATNLMWTNNSYIANRRLDFSRPNMGRPIMAFKDDFVEIYDNAGKAEKDLGVHRGNIYKCLKGLRLTTGGYKFVYADNK